MIPVAPRTDETVVSKWVDAFNERDLEGLLACVTEDIEFSPLRLASGSADIYMGHDGLRLWFEELKRNPIQHELRIDELRENGPNEVLLIGTVDVPGSSPVADFYGIYDLHDGLIARVHHWLSDLQTMEKLGLIPGLKQAIAQENIELARRSVEAINRRDLDGFLAVMATDATVQPQFADRAKGNDGIARWWKTAVEGIPDLTVEVLRLRDPGDDLTLAEVKARGQGTSGMPFEQTYWAPARWRDGRCSWWGVFLSERDALQAAELSE